MSDLHLAHNRFGIGARPGDVAGKASGERWLLAQLKAKVAPSSGLPTRADAVAAFTAGRGDDDDGDDDTMSRREALRSILQTEVEARLQSAITTNAGFVERLVWFWSNHFTVSANKPQTTALAGLFEREVVRARLGGSFSDLLIASTTHPAMLLYLDQAQSVGPRSLVGQRREAGFNENLAREVLELHTLGVGGGYTQTDVTELARALTGFTVSLPKNARFAGGAPTGDFTFITQMHEPGARTVVGQTVPEGDKGQAMRILRHLARHPSTARHIATKLARHFIADQPPTTAVRALERAFTDSNGHLPTVHAALVTLPEAWAATRAKYKTPAEYAVSALRLLGVDAAPPAIVPALHDLGQPPLRAPSPAGWADTAIAWSGPDALLRRVQWAQAMARHATAGDVVARFADVLGPALRDDTREAIRGAGSREQAFVIGLLSPDFLYR